MGIMDKFFKRGQEDARQQPKQEARPKITEYKAAGSSRIVKEDFSGQEYSFMLDNAFKWAKSHAGEVEMLYTYAPDEEFGDEGARPYIAIQEDDAVFCAIDEFKETGTFEGAMELEVLSGKFLFRAKREYYGDIMLLHYQNNNKKHSFLVLGTSIKPAIRQANRLL